MILLLSLLSALINTIGGMAGGVFLITCLSFIFNPLEALALHAIAQALSNLIRVFLFRQSINWRYASRFLILSPIGLFFGLKMQPHLSLEFMQVLLALFILIFAVKNFRLRITYFMIPFVGAFSAFLSMTIGVVGPFVSLSMLAHNLKKEELIGTKSLCQCLIQASKVILFSQALDFSYQNYSYDLTLLFSGLFMGSFLGKKVLHRIPLERFNFILRVMLVLTSLILLGKVFNTTFNA